MQQSKLSASGNSASGHPQHLVGDSFDCCTERYEIVVYCSDPSEGRGCVLYIIASIPVIKIEFDNNFQESIWCSINLTGSDKF